MILITPRLQTFHLWPQGSQLGNLRYLARYHILHNNNILNHQQSMPPKEPSKEQTEQETTQNTRTSAQDAPQISQLGQGRVLRPRAGQPTNHRDNGDSSIPASYQQQPFHKLNSKTYPKGKIGHGNTNGKNSIHSTDTLTRPSFLNSQSRTRSTQQTTPSDTEDLTQALAQLMTQDNSQTTASTIEPTKSRWRTAKPKQMQSNNATTNKTAKATKAPPHNPNAQTSQPRATQTRSKKHTNPSDKKIGMTIGFPSFMAW